MADPGEVVVLVVAGGGGGGGRWRYWGVWACPEEVSEDTKRLPKSPPP